MKAADLIALASAHGVDISQAARQETQVRRSRKAAYFAKLRPDDYGNPVVPLPCVSARGTQSHVTRKRQFSHAELGMAMSGLHGNPDLAVRYSYLCDRSSYPKLVRELAREAIRLGEARGWNPSDATPSRLALLAELTLDEDANMPIFRAAPSLFAWYLALEQEIWLERWLFRYLEVKHRYEAWLAIGLATIQRPLREPSERADRAQA